ncbi:MAG: hypothetical protein D6688_05820 [Alphaproteobacteria bacterium]|nr:MAG: hypothetical protein D6688_05820 [Alphaproteobacteria bacterium]
MKPGKVLLAALLVTTLAKAATSLPIAAALNGSSAAEKLLKEGATAFEGGHGAEATDSKAGGAVSVPQEPALRCETPEEVLQSLAKEREVVAEQRRRLEVKKSEVDLARQKLEVEKEAMLELKGSIEDLLGKIEAQQTDDLKRLIAFYENMKPDEAANIMNDLDIEVVIMVLGTMKPRAAAPILAKMSPVRARAVSKIILERSKLPGDQRLKGVRLN